MDRSPRRLALATGLAGLAALSVGADDCADDGATTCGALTFTAPAGFAEWVPGGAPVDIDWTADGGGALDLELVDGDRRLELGVTDAASHPFAFDGTAGGAPVPPGNYHVAASRRCDAAPVDGGTLHLLVVQGLTFHDAALTFTGSQATRDVVVTTVTRSTMTLELLADDRVFARATIPGELLPVAHSYPFTGMDTGGAPIPAGTYTIRARLAARGGSLTYEVAGPTLTWSPGS